MKNRTTATAIAAFTVCTPLASQAQTDIQWWHSMTGSLNEWVNDQARQVNES